MGHHTGPDKPKTLEIRPNSIPDALKAISHWVVWTWRQKNKQDGEIVWKKPPRHPVTNNPRYKGPEGQSTFDHAYDRWRVDDAIDGVGFVLIDTGYVGIDIDASITNRKMDDRARDLIESFNSFTEASPSATGVHILIEGEFDGPDCHVDYQGLTVELYRRRYVTLTGRRIKGTPAEIKNRQLVLDGLLASGRQSGQTPAQTRPSSATPADEQKDQQSAKQSAKQPAKQPATQPARSDTPSLAGHAIPPKYHGGMADEDVINKARGQKGKGGALFKRLFDEGDISGYPSLSEADMALCGKLPFWVNDDIEQADRIFRQSALFRLHGRADKWDERRGIDSTYGRDSIVRAICNHYMANHGWYGYARKEKRQPRCPAKATIAND